ncbi:g1921 [Coccomyxa elongata]
MIRVDGWGFANGPPANGGPEVLGKPFPEAVRTRAHLLLPEVVSPNWPITSKGAIADPTRALRSPRTMTRPFPCLVSGAAKFQHTFVGGRGLSTAVLKWKGSSLKTHQLP